MAMVYLLLGVWLVVRLGDHGVVFVQPFLVSTFQKCCFDFCKGDTLV